MSLMSAEALLKEIKRQTIKKINQPVSLGRAKPIITAILMNLSGDGNFF